MENVVEKDNSNVKRCIITTGVSSLNYYNNYMQQFNKDNEALYNCMGKDSITSIDKAEYYNIIIDLSDYNIKTIVFEIFNYLLPLHAYLYVKLIRDDALTGSDTHECIELLEKLHRNQLIELEIINKMSHSSKREETSSWLKKFKNLFFFIGPGNTGKTSIISALTELCNEKNKSVGLIDLTEGCKLMNYFPDVRRIGETSLKDQQFKKKFKNKHTGLVDVYRCSGKHLKGDKNLQSCIKLLKELTSGYDYVFVNADVSMLEESIDLFRLADKTFIIHDMIPTKINITKHILLNFAATGINTNPNIALVYNKTIRCSFSLKSIEEKMIFKKLNNKKLVPLVDLNSKAFEIPYSKKTMGAIINNISTKRSIIHNASYSYRRNIEYIYNHINNLPYVEIEDMSITDYFKYCFKRVSQQYYIHNTCKIVERYLTTLRSNLQSYTLVARSRFIEKH